MKYGVIKFFPRFCEYKHGLFYKKKVVRAVATKARWAFVLGKNIIITDSLQYSSTIPNSLYKSKIPPNGGIFMLYSLIGSPGPIVEVMTTLRTSRPFKASGLALSTLSRKAW